MDLLQLLAILRVPDPQTEHYQTTPGHLPIPGAPPPPNATLGERIIDGILTLPINNIWPIILVLIAFIACIVWIVKRKRKGKRWYAWPLPLAIVIFLLIPGAGVNYFFGYFLTPGDFIDAYAFPTGGEQLLHDSRGHYPGGVVVSANIPSNSAGVNAQDAAIFLPPQYFTAPANYKFPVIYMFPGVPGTELDWFVSAGAWKTALDQAKAGNPVVLISVGVANSYGQDTECVNGLPGQWETYLSSDVPTWAQKNVRILTGNGATAVAGLSMGGYCAQMLAARHPDQYSLSGNFSGTTLATYPGGMEALFGPIPNLDEVVNSYNTNWIIENKPASRSIQTSLIVGASDDPLLIADQKQFNAEASALGMTTSFEEIPGRHEFHTWTNAFQIWLPQALNQLDDPAPVR